MALSVALQIDPIEKLNPHKDASLLLGLEAQKRGHKLFYYTPDKLSWRDGKVIARGWPLKLHENPAHYYDLGKPARVDLSTMDVILLRQDPPFDMGYISTTYLLEKLHPKTLVVNNPSAVRDYPEKLFTTLFRQFMPPTLISSDIEEIRDFRKSQKDIVIKPLYGFSGGSVFRLKADDDNFTSLMEVLLAKGREPWIAQRYLPEMKTKECRIVMIDGEFAAIAGRIPSKGETRASFHVGATYTKTKLTKRHRDICAAVGSVLKKHGLIFAGLDIIGDYLTEINITSPGTLAGITKLYSKKLEADIWDAIESRL